MPLENQRGENQNHKQAATDRWAEISSILLDNKRLPGTWAEIDRAYNNAELDMAKELEKFSKDGFEIVDTDKNGYISREETAQALKNPPAGTKKEMFQYLQKNMNELEGVSDDEWLWERSGVTKKDISGLKGHLHEKLDEWFVADITKALKDGDLANLESVVRECTDRPGCLDWMLEKTRYELPGDSCELRLRFYKDKYMVNGKEMTGVNIQYSDLYSLEIPPDKSIPTRAFQSVRTGWFSSEWRETDVDSVMRVIKKEANAGRMHHYV